MSRPKAGFPDRIRQARRLLRAEGPAGIADRVRGRLVEKLSPPGSKRLVVSRDDFARAAEIAKGGWVLPGPADWHPGEPLTVAWVCTPPAPGSGGHTTMFRMVSALERAGHTCVVYLQDQHGWDIEQHRRIVRSWWPGVKAEVRDFADGIEDCHVIFATGWGTAYAVLGSEAKGLRCYFVQDFEPAFSPAGSEYLLAEATFRFGFVGVTAGKWLAQRLQKEYGMQTEYFDFGCDLEEYSLDRSVPTVERIGIAYYCRPSTPRRAHELAMFALDLFAAEHPEVDIHFFGQPCPALPFRAIHHGLLTPAQLNDLYNRCVAGLVLSATNVSLVPQEMLAAGCIPVVNDAEQNRMVLDNPHVAYSMATPYDLAATLCSLVERPIDVRARAAYDASASVTSTTWDAVGEDFERIVQQVVAARV